MAPPRRAPAVKSTWFLPRSLVGCSCVFLGAFVPPDEAASKSQSLSLSLSLWSWPGIAVRRTASLSLAYARPSIHFAIAPELQSFPGCCAALSARLRASSTRYDFAAWCAADRGSIMSPALLWAPALLSSAKNAAPRPGHEWNLLSLPCGDLPVGRFVDRGCPAPFAKIFRFSHTPNHF
jgi:hypothetical protein